MHQSGFLGTDTRNQLQPVKGEMDTGDPGICRRIRSQAGRWCGQEQSLNPAAGVSWWRQAVTPGLAMCFRGRTWSKSPSASTLTGREVGNRASAVWVRSPPNPEWVFRGAGGLLSGQAACVYFPWRSCSA